MEGEVITLAEMYEVCCGAIGMSVESFKVAECWELLLAIKGYYRHTEAINQREYTIGRSIAFHACHPEERKKITVAQFWPLPWDSNSIPIKAKNKSEEPESESDGNEQLAGFLNNNSKKQ